MRESCLGGHNSRRTTLLMSSLKRTSVVVTGAVGPRIVWYEVMAVIFIFSSAE